MSKLLCPCGSSLFIGTDGVFHCKVCQSYFFKKKVLVLTTSDSLEEDEPSCSERDKTIYELED